MNQYHVWVFNARRRQLTMLDSKRIGRWDTAKTGAVWQTRAAAHAWAKRNVTSTAGYRVLKCDGVGRRRGSCGMGKASHS